MMIEENHSRGVIFYFELDTSNLFVRYDSIFDIKTINFAKSMKNLIQ